MIVKKVLVEGELDAEILRPIFAGKPVVDFVGGKGALISRARLEREDDEKSNCIYLRDRDFDSEPSLDRTGPNVDREGTSKGLGIFNILGFKWQRHSLENYMLEPSIVCKACGFNEDIYKDELVRAVTPLKYYQASRWAIGLARASLPPNYSLTTQPEECEGSDFKLPADQSLEWSRSWLESHIKKFRDYVFPRLSDESIICTFDDKLADFSKADFDFSKILIWYSGKDIFSALAHWLNEQGYESPGLFRNTIRDWMIDNPTSVIDVLDEWKALIITLRQKY